MLAAHSAAGLLLPALAQRLDAVHLVWLAAAVADYAGGHSLLDEIRADRAAVFNQEWIGVDPTSDPVLATYFFLFHDADLAHAAVGAGALRAFVPARPGGEWFFLVGGQRGDGAADGRPAHPVACWQDDKVKGGKGIRRATALSQR